MNERAGILGMPSAYFVDPTGLKVENTGTVADVSILARYAWRNSLLKKLSSLKEVRVVSSGNRLHKIKNTNRLLHEPKNFLITASKTGYLEEAGYNVAMQVKLKNNHEYLLVLMNAPSLEERAADTLKIVNWLESL